MPGNHGQCQKSTWWYKLCFIPTSADSSDDSDTESVILPPSTQTQTSTWQQPSPPHPPPSPPTSREPQIDWLNLPPPPPPPPPPPFFPPSPTSQEHGNNWHDSPPPLFPLSPTSQEPQIHLRDLYPPPSPTPSLPSMEAWADALDIDSWQGWPEDDESVCLQVLAIRRVRISELQQSQRDKLSDCPICKQEFKVGDQAIQLPCNHTFRSECILRWLNNRKTCPICRLQLP